MRNVSISFAFIFIMILPIGLYAQVFGVRGGLNLSKMTMKSEDMDLSDDFEIKPGLHIGPTVEFPLSENSSIEAALLLSQKGIKDSYKETYDGGYYESKMVLNLWYIDIPILYKYKFQIGDKIQLFPALGPYVGIGLSGKSKNEFKSNYGNETHSSDIEWGSDEETDMLKRLDAGLTIGGGLDINAFEFGINYNVGIANISTYTEQSTKIKNKVLQFYCTYKFLNN